MSGSLEGHALARATVQIPAWGVPWADVELATPASLEVGAAVSLVVADATLAMVVASGAALHGRAAYRLTGGRGGWARTIPAKSYANDAGIKAASVYLDAAAACGETIDAATLPATRMGPHYARLEGLASAVLPARGWYVGLDGVTRIGARAATTYAGGAPRVRVDSAAGIVELATEAVAALVPGVVVDGAAPATDVEWFLEPSRLTARVWGGPAPTSRRMGALGAIVASMVAPYRYRGIFEFRVVTQTGERLNLQPVRVATGLADLANVPVRPGVAGVRADVTPGELVLVAFVDGDPSRPVVVGHDSAESPAWMPLGLELGGPGALGVARTTDAVQAGAFAGVIVGGSARIRAVS